jgi:hypothetical protein
MPVRWAFQDGWLVMELAGRYESQDVVRGFLDALEDPSCPPQVRLIVDVSRSESLAARPAEEIRSVARFLGSFAQRIGARCAVVAASDVHFGLGQMGATHSQAVGVDARVFRTSWLGEPIRDEGSSAGRR